MLKSLKGIGPEFAGVLWSEGLYRSFSNRRQVVTGRIHFARGAVRPDPAGRAFCALLKCAADGLSARRFAEYLSLGQVPDATPDGAPPDAIPGSERWALVKAAINGRLPRGFGVKRLMDLPMAWHDQWSGLGLRAPAEH